jgi:tRNA pseudouridine38-40 synthase
MNMRNIRLVLQYEGTRYQGWQKQEGQHGDTIQGKLETLLSKMCESSDPDGIQLFGSGRTDAGVHARRQVANFHTNSAMPCEEIEAYCNRYLPEDIVVTEASEVSERFHSRLHTTGKCYHYQVMNSSVPDVFRRRYAFLVEDALDVAAMQAAALYLVGEHDFKSFTSAKKGKKPTVRRIDDLQIKTGKDHMITFTVKGSGFLYHMVRIIVGTLLEVGMGKRSPQSIKALLDTKDREQAGFLVPAHGLTLWDVYY